MNRRDFLRQAAAISLLFPAPSFALAPPQRPRSLVIVELNGGNDGLNTLIPYADPAYYQLRPTIGIARDRVLQLADGVGLHPSMAPLMPSWEAGDMAIVEGLGYPEPNLSHFRSIEIWDTGLDSSQRGNDGWMGVALRDHPLARGDFAFQGVVLGRNPRPLQLRDAGDSQVLVVNRVDAFLESTAGMAESATLPPLAAELPLRRSLELVQRGRVALAAPCPCPEAMPAFPRKGHFGDAMRDVFTLLLRGNVAPIIKVSISGFDMHANLPGRHQRLLEEFAGSMAAFREGLVKAGLWDDVMVMTYSEFGRRAAENAQKGADHGTAAPHFVMGGRVRGGLYGQRPSLTDLDGGNLRHTVHFRRLYNTALLEWLGLSGSPYSAQQYRGLGLVRA